MNLKMMKEVMITKVFFYAGRGSRRREDGQVEQADDESKKTGAG